MIIERLARAIADFTRRREDAAERRRVARRALEKARADARAAAEAASGAERLGLARRVFAWATVFVFTIEGRWAFSHWQRWRIGWDLDLDARGRLWRAADGHSFGRVPARLIASPEELAAMYSTARLRDAVSATEENFWSQALSKGLVRLLLPRGRII